MDEVNIPWDELSDRAWKARKNAHLFGNTGVGAAAYAKDANIYIGCNIEHQFRSHDIHAEISAIANMISNGSKEICAILIVAEREFFTPCGSCMDWIIQFGGKNCVIGFQNGVNTEIVKYLASELMPHYPY